MKVKVEKLSNNPNTFGSKLEQLDTMPVEPIIGHPLTILSSDPDCYKGGIRTSIVKEVIHIDNFYTVKTRNSTYRIEVLEE